MKMTGDTTSKTHQRKAPNILITPWDYPRYIASDVLYNESMKKLKYNIYKNKCRAHRGRARFPDHVTMVPANSRPGRPWYGVHQCLDEKCSIHPGTLKLTDVTETRKEKGENSGFICSYLKDKVDIRRYPFYKRSIECYKSSFDKQKSGINTVKIRSGVWHDPTCKQCERKELHNVTWLEEIPQIDDETLHADIWDIFYKYKYVFDPNYVLGNNFMSRNISKMDRAEDLKLKKNLDIVYAPDAPRHPPSYYAKFNFDSDSSAPSPRRATGRARLARHTPKQNYNVSLPYFSRQNTPIYSPVQGKTSLSPYTLSSYQQPLTPCGSAGGSPFWTSYRQPIRNSVQTYNPTYFSTSQTSTIPGQQCDTIPDQNQFYGTPKTQSLYHDSCDNSTTTVFGSASRLHPTYSANWSPTPVPINMWYQYNLSYWPHPQWASAFSPGHSSHRLGEAEACNMDFNRYKRDRESDYDVEDPLKNVDTGHAKTFRGNESGYEDTVKNWHGEKPYNHIHRYKDSSSNFDNYSFVSSRYVRSSRDREWERSQCNRYRKYCERQDRPPAPIHPKRRKPADDDRHHLKRSNSCARKIDSFRSTANWRGKKEDEPKHRAPEDCQRERKRQALHNRTCRSYRRSFKKSHIRDRSPSPKLPRVASTVMVVHKERRSKSKRDRRK